MNCPYCGNTLPLAENRVCPVCGKDLITAETALAQPAPHSAGLYWLLFFAVLLAPPLLTLLAVQGGRKAEGAAVACSLLGGPVAGIVCGIMIGKRFGTSNQSKIILGLVSAGVLAVLCTGASCFGCLAGGFKMDFR